MTFPFYGYRSVFYWDINGKIWQFRITYIALADHSSSVAYLLNLPYIHRMAYTRLYFCIHCISKKFSVVPNNLFQVSLCRDTINREENFACSKFNYTHLWPEGPSFLTNSDPISTWRRLNHAITPFIPEVMKHLARNFRLPKSWLHGYGSELRTNSPCWRKGIR